MRLFLDSLLIYILSRMNGALRLLDIGPNSLSQHQSARAAVHVSLHYPKLANSSSSNSGSSRSLLYISSEGRLQGPLKDVYQAALGLGTANQLTNILRDVGEDATERDRIYVPTQELKEFGISESEVRCSQMLTRLWPYAVQLWLAA